MPENETMRSYTAPLNAALKMVMDDKARPDPVRMWAWIWLHAHGNWSSYAIDRYQPLPVPPCDESPENIRALVIGSRPCPFCRRTAKPLEDLPTNWRWHLRCMAMAYAADAMRFGNARQQAWGEQVAAAGLSDSKSPLLVPAMGADR